MLHRFARREQHLLGFLVAVPLALLCASSSAEAAKPGADAKMNTQVKTMGRYVAIDNVCAWPNLTLLPDGSIAALIYGHPSHLQGPGDVECWVSEDGRGLWEKRGIAAPREPKTTRGNVAAGLAHNGDLVVLAAGWGYAPNYRSCTLAPWVCRSSDGGCTWAIDKAESSIVFPESASRQSPKGKITPFGDIVRLAEQTLAVSFYGASGRAWVLFSRDDGRTWGDAALMAEQHLSEATVLRLRPDRWLAASRAAPGADGNWPSWGMSLLESSDEGRTWRSHGAITPPGQYPGHLLELQDGRILLTFGMRDISAIGFRLSADEGRTWSPTDIILNIPSWKGLTFDPPYREKDLGYPATVQLTDGTLVTAYYSIGVEQHTRYHMGVVRWTLDE